MKLPQATLLLAACGIVAFAQNPSKSEPRHFAVACSDFIDVAYAYFRKHGIGSSRSHSVQDGFEALKIRTGSRDRWTDAHGNKLSDFQLYWTYAGKANGKSPAPGIWRLRLSHYTLVGDMDAAIDEQGCKVDFHLYFEAFGANVIGIFPVDSAWGYASNGRLEREYLDAISAELDQRTPGDPR